MGEPQVLHKGTYYVIPFKWHSGKYQTIGRDIRTRFAVNQRYLMKRTDWKRKKASLGGDTGILVNFKVHALITLLDLRDNLFLLTKRDLKGFSLFRQKAKSTKSAGCLFCSGPYRASTRSRERSPPSSFSGNLTLHQATSTVSCCLWASALYLHSFCVSVSKMGPTLPERPKGAP